MWCDALWTSMKWHRGPYHQKKDPQAAISQWAQLGAFAVAGPPLWLQRDLSQSDLILGRPRPYTPTLTSSSLLLLLDLHVILFLRRGCLRPVQRPTEESVRLLRLSHLVQRASLADLLLCDVGLPPVDSCPRDLEVFRIIDWASNSLTWNSGSCALISSDNRPASGP